MLAACAVIAAPQAVPDAWGLIPEISCRSVYECKYVNLFEERTFRVFVPEEPVRIRDGEVTEVLIAGTIPTDLNVVSGTMKLSGPGGGGEYDFPITHDGVFWTFVQIEGHRHADGVYSVHVWYNRAEQAGYEEIATIHRIGSGSFTVLPLETQANHTTYILAGGTGDGCDIAETCYDYPDARITAGDTVQWVNESGGPHHIRATIINDGAELRPPRPGEGFSTSVISPGGRTTVLFDAHGSYAYSCLFHPWMEGSVAVSASPGAPVADVPDSVLDIDIAPKRGLVINTDAFWHNAGDEISISVYYGDIDTPGSAARLYDYADRMIYNKFRPNTAGMTVHHIITQPSWQPGEYRLLIDPHGPHAGQNLTITVSQHGIRCTPDIGSAGTCDADAGSAGAAGTWKRCWSGHVDAVAGPDEIIVSGETVRLAGLAISDTIDHEDIANVISMHCIPGSIATVDVSDESEHGIRGGVYCGYQNMTINQMLLDSGMAVVDDSACHDIKFSWGKCRGLDDIESIEDIDDIEDIQRLAADATDRISDAVSDISDGGPTGFPLFDSVSGDNCAIAFAVRGTELAHGVQVLREWRAGIMSHGIGDVGMDAIHAAYYAVSPGMVDAMRGSESARQAALSILYLPLTAAGGIIG